MKGSRLAGVMVLGVGGLNMARTRIAAEGSGGVEGEHPLDVPGQGHEVPFSLDLVEGRADGTVGSPSPDLMMPNTGSGVCLRRALGLPALGRCQAMGHGLHSARPLRWWRGLGETLFPGEMVAFTTHGDQGRDGRLGTGFDVGFAEVAAVRQQGLGPAQRFGELLELFQRRFDLFLVVGRPEPHQW